MGKKFKSGYIVIGAGQAGVNAVESIRKIDKKTPLYLIDGDKDSFFFRAALKYMIKKHIHENQIAGRSPNFIKQYNIIFIKKEVISINNEKNYVLLKDSTEIPYEKLLIATGGYSVMPKIKGSEFKGVYVMRSLQDTINIINTATNGSNLKCAVLGGGVLGVELADSLSNRNIPVDLYIRGDILVPKMLDLKSSSIVAKELEKNGINIRYNEGIQEIIGNHEGKVKGIISNKGKSCDYDGVFICTGIRRNFNIIDSLDLERNIGIKTNEFLQTKDPNIFVAGDVCEFYDSEANQHRTLDLWGPAGEMGQIAGHNMCSDLLSYYSGAFHAYTIFNTHNCHVIGKYNPSDTDDYEILDDFYSIATKDCIFRLILQNNMIVGAFMLGESRHPMILKKIIEKKLKIPNNISKDEIMKREFDFERILYQNLEK